MACALRHHGLNELVGKCCCQNRLGPLGCVISKMITDECCLPQQACSGLKFEQLSDPLRAITRVH